MTHFHLPGALLAAAATASAFACQPARIEISLANGQPAVAGDPLFFKIGIKDESGRYCAAPHDYKVHLDAVDSQRRPIPLAHPDVLVSSDHTSTEDGSSLTLPAAGLVTIRASAPGLRPGTTSVFVYGREPRRSAALTRSASWVVPAAFVKTAGSIDVIAHCGPGGEVSANGFDSITVLAELENGPVPFPITLRFARGAIEWDGVVTIPAGAISQGVEIRSHRTGPVSLANLLSSDPPGLHLDPQGPPSCKDVRFISPAHFADLEFEAAQISYGEPVQLAIVFRDQDHNPVPIDDASLAQVQVLQGRQPSLTDPILQHGKAVLICKPNWWGAYAFRFEDASLITISRGSGDSWVEGPAPLQVTFPWIPFWFCLVFGSLGAALFALYKRELALDRFMPRIALGIGGAVLIVSLALEASLMKPDLEPYTPLILALSLVGGWSGPAAFTWYADRLGIKVAAAGAS